jgi:hypothetical protein
MGRESELLLPTLNLGGLARRLAELGGVDVRFTGLGARLGRRGWLV